MSHKKGKPTDRSFSEVESNYQETSCKLNIQKKNNSRGGIVFGQVGYNTNTIIEITGQYEDSDEITITGKKEDVEEAKILIEKMEETRKRFKFTISEVRSKPEYHKFLIGRGGANIKKLRESTGAVIIFPNSDDADQETIRVKGFHENVKAAVSELEKTINELDNTVEVEMDVEMKYHGHFLTRRAEVLCNISKEHGGVNIRFPRKGVVSERVVIKGAKDDVEGAKKKISDIAADLALKSFQLQVEVDPSHYYKIIGRNGTVINKIRTDHDVRVQLPDSNKKNQNLILITGYEANTHRARDEILSIVNDEPITIMVRVPLNYHQSLIGQNLSNMMRDLKVKISIPPPAEKSELVSVSGPPENTKWARKALEDRVAQLDAANKGNEDRVTGEVAIYHRFHPRLIGFKSRTVRRIMDDYKVDIRFPRSDAKDPDVVTITGSEDDVYDCKDHLLNLQEEYVQDEMEQH